MVYLVYGSPCSGKSTYIAGRMGDGDILCDVDYIYSAISGRDAHDADLWAHETALKLREYLLDIIRNRDGGWRDAYVVSIANTDEQVRRDAERVNADECIYIDTPMGECLRRAKLDDSIYCRAHGRPPYFTLLIEDWFATRDFNEQRINRIEYAG